MNEEQESYLKQIEHAPKGDIIVKHTGREVVVLPPHQHQQIQVVMAQRGTLRITIEDREYFVPEGYWAWIPSKVRHALSSNNRFITLDIFYLPAEIAENEQGKKFTIYHNNTWIASNLQYISSQNKVISPNDTTLYRFCWAFFTQLISLKGSLILSLQGVALNVSPVLRDALRFIHQHLSDDLRIADVAQSVGLSVRTLNRMMQTAGISFSSYLNYQRITRALELIADGTMNMKEIAFSIGFSSPSNFNRAFKLLMGASPKSFLQSKRDTKLTEL